MIKCIAIDDEPLALDLLEDNISMVPYLQLTGKCNNAFEAIEILRQQPVDLIFALFAPKDAGAEHLRALARVSRLLRQPELREQLRHARNADAIHALLVQETSVAKAVA